MAEVNEPLIGAYTDGLTEGTRQMLDYLANSPVYDGSSHSYTGPIPPELRAWIEQERAFVDHMASNREAVVAGAIEAARRVAEEGQVR